MELRMNLFINPWMRQAFSLQTGLQPAREHRGDEPRELSWAGMKDIFGVETELRG
jgi:hypothetical protein